MQSFVQSMQQVHMQHVHLSACHHHIMNMNVPVFMKVSSLDVTACIVLTSGIVLTSCIAKREASHSVQQGLKTNS